MISLSFLYILVGLLLLWTAVLTLGNKQQPRRFTAPRNVLCCANGSQGTNAGVGT